MKNILLFIWSLLCMFLHRKELIRKQIENDPQYQKLVADMKVLVTLITNNPEHYLTINERKGIAIRVDEALQKVTEYKINRKYYGYSEYYVLKVAKVDLLTKLTKLNENFVKESLEKYKEFFDNIDGKSLDEQQRKAVVIDEQNNLVIAGAGSGKTLTILAKVLYLLKRGISPQEILLIAFTRKSAGELEERVNRNLSLKINVSTFHKLGLDIITKSNSERPDIDDNMETYIEDYFSKELIKHQEDVQIFLEFIGYYFNIPLELNADGTLGEKIEKEQSVDLETLNEKYNKTVGNGRKTIKGERVKSIEELVIANFLFLNGINYEYEREYPHKTDKLKKRYRPDFYLVDHDIYLEHFGVDKNNHCPWLSKIEEKKYIEDMLQKRETHKANNTKLIETYSYYQSEGKLVVKLKDILLSNNVKLTPIPAEDMLLLVNEIHSESVIQEFIKLCRTFISLFKTNGYDKEDFRLFREKFENVNNRNYINQFISIRTLHFLNIIEKIYLYYQMRLSENKTIDFPDMINIATKSVKENGISNNYKYIIIDEYQDIGMDRYKLIKAIVERTSAHLMCVGDDWQSIYRFAGSDANLFMNFDGYWGATEVSKIENTYRNSQELINIASSFIMKNGRQIPKLLRSGLSHKDPICLHYYNENNFYCVLGKILKNIANEYGEEAKVMLLGRTNYDIQMLQHNKNQPSDINNDGGNPFTIKDNKVVYKEHDKLKIEFLTVHKAKGLEAENVIILNMSNDKLGFPNKMADDPVLQLLLPIEDSFPFAEERRLFYVALTRTKHKTHILVPDDKASEFANELKSLCHLEIPEGENLIINNPKCPRCKTGRLILKQKDAIDEGFVGCSNFPACDFTSKYTSIMENPTICPSCGGFLVARSGKYGQFLGCTNYPICEYKSQSNIEKKRIGFQTHYPN